MLTHAQFDFDGVCLLERQVFRTPFEPTKAAGEAVTFLHMVNGAGMLHTPSGPQPMAPSDSAILTRGGDCRVEWSRNADRAPHAVLLVHFHPEVLLAAYRGMVPEMFRLAPAFESVPINRIPLDRHVANYIESLEFYFRQSALMSDELMLLKMKELLCLLVHSEQASKVKAVIGDCFNRATQPKS